MKPVKNKLYSDIKSILDQARGQAVKAVNFSMVIAYWQIGKRIVEEEQGGNQKAGYGEYILKDLAKKLNKDFGRTIDERELRRMRQFFLQFSIRDAVRPELKKKVQKEMRDAVRPELTWTHYRLLLRVENKDARSYYLNEAVEQNWSTRTLERQINSLYFERLLSSKKKNGLVVKSKKESDDDKPTILDFVKDPYVLEFLSLRSDVTYHEKELETELLNKVQLFLLELGKGFSFVARQKRISAEDEDFFIDLVFYNYILKCFVIIDLKVGKLTHQDIGQMDLYVRYYEEEMKLKTDNPTIGLILCTEKNEAIVKYSILKESRQIFASKYKLILPSEKELIAELKSELKLIRSKNRKKVK